MTSEESRRSGGCKRENAELRRANEILKSASVFFAAELDRPQPVLVRFISEHKHGFGVEPICRVLSQHGCQIAPSTYYDAVSRAPSARSRRDELLKTAIARVHAENFGVYGARKVWLQLQPRGHGGGPLHGGAADARAGPARRPPRQAGPHHDRGSGRGPPS